MIANKKFLALIPARGGSKGIPNKNIKDLGGKPLLQWSFDAARSIEGLDEIIISTDDEKIIDVALKIGLKVPFRRPDTLATDEAGTVDVLLHAIDHYASLNIYFDYLVLLQPTSPFRKQNHIEEAIQLMLQHDCDMVVSVTETSSNPYYTLFEEDQNGFLTKSKESTYTRRQDCPSVYEYNGAVYIINIASLLQERAINFKKTIKYVMEDQYSLDIDTPLDWQFAEFLIQKDIVL